MIRLEELKAYQRTRMTPGDGRLDEGRWPAPGVREARDPADAEADAVDDAA
jgi:hypothetical protein